MGRGGDPDLFVYRVDFSEAFFVETKEPVDRSPFSRKIPMSDTHGYYDLYG
jgi:hypothetical protein